MHGDRSNQVLEMRPYRLLPQRGFTLIELLTVLMIVAVLATIATPSFRDLLINQRLASTSSDFVATLTTARSEAIKYAQPVKVAPLDSSWDNGWTIKTGTGGAEVLLRTFDKLPDGVARDSSLGNGFSNAVTYDANGFARDADGKFGTGGCVTFKALTQRRVSVILSPSGRARTCNPDKSGDCGTGDCNTAG
jgi:type IV fimbrial biogenesis protein FimT